MTAEPRWAPGVGVGHRNKFDDAMRILLSFLLIPFLLFASGCDSGANGADEEEQASELEWASRFGVNLAGAEFGSVIPGNYAGHYIYPSGRSLDYYTSKGIHLIRLPFKWERMQRELYGPLHAEELQHMDEFIAGARARDVRVILDAHNYGRRKVGGTDHIIGSPPVPLDAFGDFWKKLAAHYADEEAVWAYGLMNEPHDMGRFDWFDAAQAAIDSIRTVDMDHVIAVGGNSWSNAERWPRVSDDLIDLEDPADLIAYEAHIYFDDNYSGTYDQSYEGEDAYPMIGVDRVRPFVRWLEANDAVGFIGEFGVPAGEQWMEVLRNFLSYLSEEGVGGTYWAGGPWWGDYPLSIEPPRRGEDRPQMEVLEEFTQ